MCSVVFPYFGIPAFFIGLTYRALAIGYLNTGRDLRRMESNSRSPIFSDFGELLEGIVTVRAFSAEKRFLDNLHLKIDMTTKVGPSLSFNYFLYRRLLDVVHILDDKSLALVELRCLGCFGSSCHDLVLDSHFDRWGWSSRFMYH